MNLLIRGYLIITNVYEMYTLIKRTNNNNNNELEHKSLAIRHYLFHS